MTNNTERFIALATDAAATATTDNYRDNALARICRDLHILATAELFESLTAHNRDYYFSDSTYDELSNPSRTIAACDTINNYCYDYESTDNADEFAADISEFLDCLDYHLSYALTDTDDAIAADFTLDDLSALLRTAAAPYQIMTDAITARDK